MLEAPRELLARALLPLNPLDPPPNPPAFDALLLDVSRLPVGFPPALALRVLAPLPPRSVVLAPAVVPRVPPADWALTPPPAPRVAPPPAPSCWVEAARVPPADWPRVDPPYLFAVALFE